MAEKQFELSRYELNRKPQELILDSTEIKVQRKALNALLMCPICLDILRGTMTTKECLHRFCQECITTALRSGNKECPTCRKVLSPGFIIFWLNISDLSQEDRFDMTLFSTRWLRSCILPETNMKSIKRSFSVKSCRSTILTRKIKRKAEKTKKARTVCAFFTDIRDQGGLIGLAIAWLEIFANRANLF